MAYSIDFNPDTKQYSVKIAESEFARIKDESRILTKWGYLPIKQSITPLKKGKK